MLQSGIGRGFVFNRYVRILNVLRFFVISITNNFNLCKPLTFQHVKNIKPSVLMFETETVLLESVFLGNIFNYKNVLENLRLVARFKCCIISANAVILLFFFSLEQKKFVLAHKICLIENQKVFYSLCIKSCIQTCFYHSISGLT